MNRHIVPFVFGALILLDSTFAHAAPTYFDLRIPASACRPIAEDTAKVQLSDGAWVFSAGQSGVVTLFCPLHTSEPSSLEDSNYLAVMRLWYKDPDGTGTASSISADLKRRKFDASVDSSVSGGTVTSQSFSETNFHRPGPFVSHTADFVNFSYHVEITMARSTSTSSTPVFVGVDFAQAPLRPGT